MIDRVNHNDKFIMSEGENDTFNATGFISNDMIDSINQLIIRRSC